MPTHTEILKAEMKQQKVTLAALADRLGLSGTGRASDRVNRKNCTVKGLAGFLEGLDCELVVKAPDGREYVIKADDYV